MEYVSQKYDLQIIFNVLKIMILVYKFNIGENENISFLCKISNNLYNQALYIFRETLSKEDKWLSYFELDAIMKITRIWMEILITNY